ncbi:YbhB/YbcL family Raf kinase inhibitor-like protein [Aspergillus clavatus NRRL 1]|uniref:PEBP-like protein n=1 Tax=Aspergillus clavatus (strain ATCC 1007 / CBS 513.65 / DSM 816 / NCTC 3887 / NRRL 1 / QM 1276 / 107) TaxID=344612 RepID=A1CFU7_ASPCL|nr:uncharacterized protein ACLA_094460 [Aspergillus clavatus NRRL 1]EAW11746.1 conserved hypothetical protein [Aspergillus clavatus NRRL 1]
MHLTVFTISYCLLLTSVNGQHEKLFTSRPAFAKYPYPTISLRCHEIGPSGSTLHVDHMAEGAGYVPSLSWPSAARNVREYLLVSEDPDAPLSHSVIHGLYYGIPRVFTGIDHEDFELNEKHDDPYLLKGGFRYGQNRGDTVYLPPRSLPGQGPHRYFYELIALNQPIDRSKLSDRATLEEIEAAIRGKVVGWGAWAGVVKNEG